MINLTDNSRKGEIKLKKTARKQILLIALPCLSIAALFAIGKVVPHAVEYTVKTEKNEETDFLSEADNETAGFIVKTVGNRICVTSGGKTINEIDIKIEELTESDRKRLADGIAVENENDVLALKEYLES